MATIMRALPIILIEINGLCAHTARRTGSINLGKAFGNVSKLEHDPKS